MGRSLDNTGQFTRQPLVLLIAPPGPRRAETEGLVAMAGARLAGSVAAADAARRLAEQSAVDLLMVEAADIDAGDLLPLADRLHAFAEACDCPVVIALAQRQIDAVSASMLGGRYVLLCDASAAERLAALSGVLAGGRDAWLNDASRDSEAVRLQRLNEEVARIAETLARLTRGDARQAEAPAAIVADRAQSYGAPVLADDGPAVTASELRRLIRARRMRDQYMGEGLFEDPAWDMLLDLYAAHLEHAQVSVSSLCIAAAVPPTTALRWISRMTDAGLFEREPDPFDRRRAFMMLSPRAAEGMAGYFTALRQAGLPALA